MEISNQTGPYGQFAPRGLVARILVKTRHIRPSWASRRWGFLLRRIAVFFLGGKPVDIERLGARMRLYPYNNVSEKRILFTPQFFDPEELALLASRMNDDFVFIDIGANIGGYALFVAARTIRPFG